MKALARFLLFFFKLLYSRLAWSYDLVAWLVSLGQWQGWVLSALDPSPSGPVLELGHGPGHLLRALAGHGIRGVGLDRSPQMSRIACRRLRSAGLEPWLVRADADRLPFASESFRTVLATFPTEYALSPRCPQEVWRVLLPGSRYALLPSAEITGRAWWDRFTSWLFRTTGQVTRDPSLWMQPLSAAGFAVSLEERITPRARLSWVTGHKPGRSWARRSTEPSTAAASPAPPGSTGSETIETGGRSG